MDAETIEAIGKFIIMPICAVCAAWAFFWWMK